MTRLLGFGLLVLLAAGPAAAQATCTLPRQLPIPRPDGHSRSQPRRVVPIGGYTLALSWSPRHCATTRRVDHLQCGNRNRFGFILHGLWPDGQGRGWPQYCKPVQRLSAAVLRANLCAIPSVDLMQHQWAKHGSCMAGTPERYFAIARTLYDPLRFPDMALLAREKDLTVARFTEAFLALNPRIGARSVRIRFDRGGWFDEIQLCYDRRLKLTACRGGLHASSTQVIRINP